MPLHDNLKPDPSKTPKAVAQEQALKALQDLFSLVDKDKLKILLTRETSKRRAGTSTLTQMPYYRERYALELRVTIDTMMREAEKGIFEDRLFAYSDYEGMSHNTIYLRVNQAKLYLLDNLDFDGAYRKFFEKLTVTRERGRGVRISYQRDIISPNSINALTPSTVLDKEEQTIHWKDQIDKFIEESTVGQELLIDKLALSDEDMQDIRTSLCQLAHILFRLNTKSIWLRHLTKSEIESLQQ